MITPFVAGRRGPLQLEVLRALVREGFEVDVERATALDPVDADACRRALLEARADVVVDCSGADDRPGPDTVDELDRLLIGSENLALAAAELDAYSVFVSSAHVFGERNVGARVESDLPAPTTALGAAVLSAERTVGVVNEQHAIVRTTALYGRYWPTPFEALLARAAAGEQIVADQKTVCPPTYAPHLAALLIAMIRNPSYGILHRAATGECSEFDLARTLVALTGVDTRVDPAPPAPEADRALRQPACLTSRRKELPSLPHWRIGLRVWALERDIASHEAGNR